MNRREFLKLSMATGAASYLATSPLGALSRAFAATQGPGLSDPAMQPKFANAVPNALDPGFIYDTSKGKIKTLSRHLFSILRPFICRSSRQIHLIVSHLRYYIPRGYS